MKWKIAKKGWVIRGVKHWGWHMGNELTVGKAWLQLPIEKGKSNSICISVHEWRNIRQTMIYTFQRDRLNCRGNLSGPKGGIILGLVWFGIKFLQSHGHRSVEIFVSHVYWGIDRPPELLHPILSSVRVECWIILELSSGILY